MMKLNLQFPLLEVKEYEQCAWRESAVVKRKKVLVTGAGGCVGGHLVRLLLETGYRVKATDLPGNEFAFGGSRVEIVEGDLTDRGFAAALVQQVHYVIHAGAELDGRLNWPHIKAVNVDATRDLWEHADALGVERFVYFSTASLYQGSERTLTEEAPLEPRGNYERSKFLAEKALLRYKFAGSKMDLVILRPALVLGPFASTFMAGMVTVPPLCRHYLGFAPKLRGGAVSNSLHALDLARAAVHLLQAGQDGQAYNVANDDPLKLSDYFNIACRAYGVPVLPLPMIPLPLRGVSRLLRQSGATPVPVWLLNSTSEKLWEHVVRRHGLKNRLRPHLDISSSSHVLRDMVLDTTRLAQTGFEACFPDYRSAITDVLEWYRRERWIP
jgi:nucleoside-diphosphate-sugar epimerase